VLGFVDAYVMFREILEWRTVREANMKSIRTFGRSVVFAASIGVFLASPASAAEVKIYAAAAVHDALTHIIADYERASGDTITVVFDTAGATREKFLADADAELLITSDVQIARGREDGALTGGTMMLLGSTVAGIAAPPGSPKPDVSTPDALRAALLAADRIAFSDPARGATVGTHFVGVIEALGITDQVMAKATLAPDGVETMRLVLEDGVDIGITQTGEILQADPDALAGAFPKEFELATAYSLWHRDDISPAAHAFVADMTGPVGREKIAAEGLVPPGAE